MMPLRKPTPIITFFLLLCLYASPQTPPRQSHPQQAHKPPHKPALFTVDDFPVTNKMFGHCDGCEVKSGPIRSSDKVWFSNGELRQTLVFELYTDDFRNEIFLFSDDDIPAPLIDSMELHGSDGNLADNKQKE